MHETHAEAEETMAISNSSPADPKLHLKDKLKVRSAFAKDLDPTDHTEKSSVNCSVIKPAEDRIISISDIQSARRSDNVRVTPQKEVE